MSLLLVLFLTTVFSPTSCTTVFCAVAGAVFGFAFESVRSSGASIFEGFAFGGRLLLPIFVVAFAAAPFLVVAMSESAAG